MASKYATGLCGPSRFFMGVMMVLVLLMGGSPVYANPVKNRIRPVSSAHATLGNSACELCHKPQNAWWPENAHYKTAEPFFKADRKVEKIARLYGVDSLSDLTRGTQVCMECHGTIVSGSEADEVLDGVGCESCHGPAGGYLKPHKAGEKALGETRPGYIKGLELGLVKLRDLNIRAKNCSSCHMITEPRLISAGHPSGDRFDFVEGLAYIKHWDRPIESPDLLKPAYQNVEASRRGAMATPVAEAPSRPLPSPPPPSASPTPASPVTTPRPGAPSSALNATALVDPNHAPTQQSPAVHLPVPPSKPVDSPKPKPVNVPPPPPPPRPAPIRPIPVPQTNRVEPPPDLLPIESSRPPRPPFPKVEASVPIDEILMIIKKRLDLLHADLHPSETTR